MCVSADEYTCECVHVKVRVCVCMKLYLSRTSKVAAQSLGTQAPALLLRCLLTFQEAIGRQFLPIQGDCFRSQPPTRERGSQSPFRYRHDSTATPAFPVSTFHRSGCSQTATCCNKGGWEMIFG